jgi:hypothetical protein
MEALEARLKALSQPFDVAIQAKQSQLINELGEGPRQLFEEIETLWREKARVLITRSLVEGLDVGKSLSGH